MNSSEEQKYEVEYQKITNRLKLYRSKGYDISVSRARLAEKLRSLPAEAVILDLGGGKGHMAVALAATGRRCVSVDLDPQQLMSAFRFARYLGREEPYSFSTPEGRLSGFSR